MKPDRQIPLIPARPARTLREHVLDKLTGFPLRQAAREQRRKEQERGYRLKPTEKPRIKEPRNAMRVFFRATFSGPNAKFRSAFKLPETFKLTVEIYRHAEHWYARAASAKEPFKQFSASVSHGVMKDQIAEAFKTQITKWSMHNSDGIEIDPDGVTEDPHGNFTAKEATHVGASPFVQGQSPNHFKTACGIVVHAHQIRSRRGQNAPSCKACKVEWDKIKPEERIA